MISGAPYLVGLAVFVMLISMSAAGLDFLFRSSALARFGKGPGLTRFFAIFYTSISLATFAVQAGLSRIWLKRFGPGRTVAVLPVAVTGASLVSLFVPGAAPSSSAAGWRCCCEDRSSVPVMSCSTRPCRRQNGGRSRP